MTMSVSMAVDKLSNVVLLFDNPSWSGVATIPSTLIRNLTALSSTIAYSASYGDDNVTVLTSRYAPTTNGLIQGLLYVPDLDYADPCASQMRDYVPDTAVRQRNLPPTNLNLIAIFPWVTETCTQRYLESARQDPLRAVIVYGPHQTSARPPPVSSPAWQLNDGGRWKTENHFPIFAVSALVGQDMVQKLSLYSGNVTEVPYGENITDLYDPDPDAYVRMWTEISVSSTSRVPSFWVFILAFVGLVLLIILLASFFMHLVQARRRRVLRRRVINGEVNLEVMGIERLTVPAQHIQTFPLYTYHYEPDDHTPPHSPVFPATMHPPPPSEARSSSSSKPPTETVAPSITDSRTLPASEITTKTCLTGSTAATDYQPLCLICLHHFKNRSTVIRELACGHIYHPDCIDEFLGQVSSLCPLCKACMLPKGYCPRITNSMVRRELALHRLRGRIVVFDDMSLESPHETTPRWRSALGKRWWKTRASRTPTPSSASTEPRGHTAFLQIDAASQTDLQRLGSEPLGPEVARARMRELAGSDITDSDGNPSTCGRLRTGVFPGFR
ncbi:hypothetical protein P8C59_008103 [Phyllachora maydis]|uniref:RING-type domain-containing protein n=1 Tax=Phyllachora maydis TaxID=1825666 RepID=A0AAD9IAH2_9PEZI|nr:hypothetical protein P8C59_008103 [Phyllachora maydis]